MRPLAWNFLRRRAQPAAPPPVASDLAARALGSEAELPMVFFPADPGGARPLPVEIYDLIEERLARRWPHLTSGMLKRGIFMPSGGLVQLEPSPRDDHLGLLEVATPECRDAFDVALHERALIEQVVEVLPEVEAALATRGYLGRLALAHNSTDHHGHHYGAHESYEVADELPVWQQPLAVLVQALVWLPPILVIVLVALLAVTTLAVAGVAAIPGVVLGALGALPLVGVMFRHAGEFWRRTMRSMWRSAASALGVVIERALPPVAGWWLHQATRVLVPFAIRRYRHDLTGHLVCRTLFTGSGTVRDDGTFALAARTQVMGAVAGLFVDLRPEKRPIFDLRELHFYPHLSFTILHRRKRLHILVGDANRSDVARVLKLGTTQLIIDVIEAGREIPGVRLAKPIDALQRISLAAGADVPLALVDGTVTTALEIERRYLRAVKEHFAPALAAPAGAPGARVRELVARWEATLDALATRPQMLARELDWVAKADLMLTSEKRSSLPGIESPDRLERLRKIDLRYAELGREGYHGQLEASGLMTRLFSAEEVRNAMRVPPAGTRAAVRGALVERYGHATTDISATWVSVSGRQPVVLDVALAEVTSDRIPDGLPPAPADDERGHTRASRDLTLLGLGTRRPESSTRAPIAFAVAAGDLVVAVAGFDLQPLAFLTVHGALIPLVAALAARAWTWRAGTRAQAASTTTSLVAAIATAGALNLIAVGLAHAVLGLVARLW